MIVDAREIGKEIHCLRRRRYPDFVLSRRGRLRANEIPVFTFHSIDPRIFQDQLKFLAVNSYRTLSADEFHDALTGGEALGRRSILLTMDDGRRSLWTFAYPLLKKYGFRATVFLVPGYVPEDHNYRPNLEDYWRGRCRYDQLHKDISGGNPLVSWPEVELMHQEGVVDFQSHTRYHHHVFTGERIVGFHHPGNKAMLYDLPLPEGFEQRAQADGLEALFGMPIYENSPLMAGLPRYLNDLRLTELCLGHVHRSGGRWFFRRPSWRRELFDLVEGWGRQEHDGGRFQSPEEMAGGIREDLGASRALIESRLPGKRVRHLCYPYGVGSEISVRISREAGFVTNFWSIRQDRRSNRSGDDPLYCTRLKADYLFRLPGRGRRALVTILGSKVSRRMRRALDYGGLPSPGAVD